MPHQSGTMLDVAGNGRYARKVTVACKRERARRLHRLAPSPQDLEHLVRTDPSVLKVSVEDMQRALAESRPAAGRKRYHRRLVSVARGILAAAVQPAWSGALGSRGEALPLPPRL